MHLSQFALLLALSVPAIAQDPLATLKDRSRVLLVFAPNSSDNNFNTQLSQFDGRAMADRDLVAISILTRWQPGGEDQRTSHGFSTSEADQAALRARFHISISSFAVILVGKDGEEKLRSSVPVSMNRINTFIDGMPMRQQEMKDRPAH